MGTDRLLVDVVLFLIVLAVGVAEAARVAAGRSRLVALPDIRLVFAAMPLEGTWTPSDLQVFGTYHRRSEGGALAGAGAPGAFCAGGRPAGRHPAGGSAGVFACEVIASVGQQRGWGRGK